MGRVVTLAAHAAGQFLGGVVRLLPRFVRRRMHFAALLRLRSAPGKRFTSSFRRCATLGNPVPLMVVRDLTGLGIRLNLDLCQKTQRGIAIYESHDSFVLKKLGELLGAGDAFVDVGAHVGYFSLLGAKRVGPTGVVFAFEPQFRMRELLTANAKLNGLENIRILPFALSNFRGKAVLHLNPFNDAGSSLRPFSDGLPDGAALHSRAEAVRIFGRQDQSQAETEVLRLDDLADSLLHGLHVRLIKVDVEGEEFAAIEGMSGLLRRDRPAVLVEIADSHVQSVDRLLTSLGYRQAGSDVGVNWLYVPA